MSGLPLDDWQFWVVSAVALGAAVLAWRRIVSRAAEGDAPCDRCAANTAAGAPVGEPQSQRNKTETFTR
jgi:hypothetical protein